LKVPGARFRRLSQIAFLALFVFLLARTEFRGTLHGARGEVRLPYPVSIFLESDPLVAVGNALATRALYTGLLWSLVILIPTLFLGRFFCGWICPLGTLNHFVSHLRKPGKQRLESNRYKRWQRLKYYLLIALLVAAVFGSGFFGTMDPISLTVRSLGLSILPGMNYGLHALCDLLYRSGIRPLKFTADALDFIGQWTLLSFRQPHFAQGFFLGLIFVTVLVLNLRFTRFWCRALCPLGALLGALSRWSILGLVKRESQCEECNRCLLNCQGGDDPIPGAQWHKAECHLCLNCTADCPEAGLEFRWFPGRANTVEGPNLERRKALGALAAGAVAIPMLRSSSGSDPRLIRPPGALEEKGFLERCIRCGECMKVCPNTALHPALVEGGFEGLWTPLLVARIGYCEPGCVLCGQVCPTGAIWRITAKEKGWSSDGGKSVRIGTAFYDRGRCLPWSMATECIVCEEWCPTSPKAIYLRPAEVTDAAGAVKQVRQPYLDPERCVGCGACEYACPVKDRAAVYVTSIGESRSRTNQILLRRGRTTELLPETGEAPGWAKSGATRVFQAANLWQYVDGDAERYLEAGVERTLTARYRYQDKLDAVADLHVMGTPEGARRIFEAEPASGSRAAALGDAGRNYGASVTFRKGRYFVRLTAYEEAPEPLEALARAIDARLVL
jgi:polyferredoxin